MTAITITPIAEDEIDELNFSGLDRKAPFVITCVTGSMFSTARHYGGMKFRGFEYDFNAMEDALYRRDVVQWLAAYRSESTKAAKQKNATLQRGLGL
jgi:hypothetical protein